MNTNGNNSNSKVPDMILSSIGQLKQTQERLLLTVTEKIMYPPDFKQWGHKVASSYTDFGDNVKQIFDNTKQKLQSRKHSAPEVHDGEVTAPGKSSLLRSPSLSYSEESAKERGENLLNVAKNHGQNIFEKVHSMHDKVEEFKMKRKEPKITQNKIRVFSTSDLRAGDHVSFSNKTHSFHAIVDAFQSDDAMSVLCFYEPLIFHSMFGVGEIARNVSGIVKLNISLNFQDPSVYKHLHEKVDHEVVRRRAWYQLKCQADSKEILDNPSFINYCLTGRLGTLLILQPTTIERLKKLALEMGSPANVAGQVIESGMKVGLVIASMTLAKNVPSAAIAGGLKTAGDFMGPVLGTATEVAASGVKIAKDKKKMSKGELPRNAFNINVAREVTKTTHAVAGGIAGSIVGEILCPIPILGGVVGGLLGGFVGSVVGHGNGKVVGQVVDKIQNRIKLRELKNHKDIGGLGKDKIQLYVYDGSKMAKVPSEERDRVETMITNSQFQIYEADVDLKSLHGDDNGESLTGQTVSLSAEKHPHTTSNGTTFYD